MLPLNVSGIKPEWGTAGLVLSHFLDLLHGRAYFRMSNMPSISDKTKANLRKITQAFFWYIYNVMQDFYASPYFEVHS